MEAVDHGLYRGHLVDKRFFDPPPPKSSAEKATDFRESSGLCRGPHFLSETCGFERFQVIDGHLPHVDDILSFQKPCQPFECEPVRSKGTRIEVLFASGQVLVYALGNRWPGDGVGLKSRHERSGQSFRPLQVRELRTLSRDDISVGRAAVNPDWALAFHPKPALLTRHAGLMDGAGSEVALVQNDAFYCLRYPLSVRVLLHCSNRGCNLLILKGLAPRHGFEPRFTAPKAAVLPLDDRGIKGDLRLV